MRVRLALVALLFATTVAAHADSVSFSIGNATQTGAPGSTLTFSGTASAPSTNSATQYLNGDAYIVTTGATFDDSPYLNTFALTLDPGQTFTGNLFTLMLPANAIAGAVYSGTFTLQGGMDANAQNNLATANFAAKVSPSVAVTPEPSSLVLLGTGVLAAAASLRRRLAAA